MAGIKRMTRRLLRRSASCLARLCFITRDKSVGMPSAVCSRPVNTRIDNLALRRSVAFVSRIASGDAPKRGSAPAAAPRHPLRLAPARRHANKEQRIELGTLASRHSGCHSL